LDGGAAENFLSRRRADASVGKSGSNDGERLRVALQRAALDVVLDEVLDVDVIGEGALALEEVCYRHVDVSVLALRKVHNIIEVDRLAPRKALPVLEQLREPVRLGVHVALDHVADGDGAGVDQGVEGQVVLVELDVVEGTAARLLPDELLNHAHAELLEGDAEVEGVGQPLNREVLLEVADVEALAADRADADGEGGGILIS